MDKGRKQEDVEQLALGAINAVAIQLRQVQDLLPSYMRGADLGAIGESITTSMPSIAGLSTAVQSKWPIGVATELAASASRLSESAASMLRVADSLHARLEPINVSALASSWMSQGTVGALIERQAADLRNVLASMEGLKLPRSELQLSAVASMAAELDRHGRDLFQHVLSTGMSGLLADAPVDGRPRFGDVTTLPDQGDVPDSELTGSDPPARSAGQHVIIDWLRENAFLAAWLAMLAAFLLPMLDRDDAKLDQVNETLTELLAQVVDAKRQLFDPGRTGSVRKSVPLHEGPVAKSPVVCRVLPSDAVTVVLSDARWLYVFVEGEDGRAERGWLFEQHLR